jgi:hypothetical protein
MVWNSGDDHARPKTGTILAQSPSFLLKATVGSRKFEFALRLSIGDVFGRIETSEVSAYNLMGLIALDPLCSRIPRCHLSRRRKQEYSVVSYLVYEETKYRFVIEIFPAAFDCGHGPPIIVERTKGSNFE